MAKKSKAAPNILDVIESAYAKSNKLTNDQLYQIHAASLELLSQTGIKVESEKARNKYAEHGCFVEGEIVKFPAHLVEECVRSAPSTVLLAGRDPKKDYMIQQGKVAFINFGEGVNTIDPYTKEYRRSTKEDVGRNAKVVDYLNVLPIAYRSVASQDYHGHIQALQNMEALMTNTSKHIFIGPDGEVNAKKIIEMAGAAVGGVENLKQRPIVTFNVCPTSPLQLNPMASDVIMLAAEYGVPVNIISMALAGATTPVTIAGTLVTHNAETLSSVVLSQITSKGAPCFYASSTTIMDMRCLTTPVGAPELGLISNAVAQLSQYYLLPSFVAGG